MCGGGGSFSNIFFKKVQNKGTPLTKPILLGTRRGKIVSLMLFVFKYFGGSKVSLLEGLAGSHGVGPGGTTDGTPPALGIRTRTRRDRGRDMGPRQQTGPFSAGPDKDRSDDGEHCVSSLSPPK